MRMKALEGFDGHKSNKPKESVEARKRTGGCHLLVRYELKDDFALKVRWGPSSGFLVEILGLSKTPAKPRPRLRVQITTSTAGDGDATQASNCHSIQTHVYGLTYVCLKSKAALLQQSHIQKTSGKNNM